MRRKLIIFSMSLLFLIGIFGTANAASFSFYGEDKGGSASAIMNFNITGTTLVADLFNTSSTTTFDNNPQAPAITGFGFDLDPDNLTWSSWILEAQEYDSDKKSFNWVTIGENDGVGYEWILTEGAPAPGGDQFAGIRLDYMPNTGGDIKGALYNPAALGSTALAAEPNYYTQARFTMVFNQNPTLVAYTTDKENEQSPLVRFQNVGEGGDGSLKLGSTPVPEPATMLLLGTGLFGLAVIRRRFKK